MTETAETSSTDVTVEAPEPPKSFDERIAFDIQEALTEVLLRHGGDIRSLGVAIDYHGRLNETAGIAKAVWITADGGPVLDAAAVFGSMTASSNLHQLISERLMQLTGQLQGQLKAGLEELERMAQAYEQRPDGSSDDRPAELGKPAGAAADQA